MFDFKLNIKIVIILKDNEDLHTSFLLSITKNNIHNEINILSYKTL